MMNTQEFMRLVNEGYMLDVVGTKPVTEGDKEKPVEVEHTESYLVSPFEVPDMMQHDEKNRPVQRKELDGMGKTTKVRLPVPHHTLAALRPDLVSSLSREYKNSQRAA